MGKWCGVERMGAVSRAQSSSHQAAPAAQAGKCLLGFIGRTHWKGGETSLGSVSLAEKAKIILENRKKSIVVRDC